MAEGMNASQTAAIIAETEHCNKCGFCLPACPTYQITRQELHSPRGRIAMIEAAARGELPSLDGLEEALSYCVGCRACEPACPSGVRYEKILEAGRNYLIRRGSTAFRGSVVSRGARFFSTRPKTMGQLTRLGQRLSRWAPLVGSAAEYQAMLPGSVAPAIPAGRPAAVAEGPRIGFFTGCVMEAVFEDANRSAQRLLEAAGFRVSVVSGQTCCGAIHWHAGDQDPARDLARHNIAAFEREQWDWIANTAGGCGAMLQEYPRLFDDDSQWQARAIRFADRVRDFTTLLKLPEARPLRYQGDGSRVVLQNSCHLNHVQHAGNDPIDLLRQVAGDEWLTYPRQDMCCGSGGLYNLNHRDWARSILDDKMAGLAATDPTRVLVNNPGCQLQMQWGVSRRQDVTADVEHVATYLWRCYQAGQ